MINQSVVDRLGTELVACTDHCAGICRDPSIGIGPRGLYLDRADASGDGCLAVGLNPGRSKPQERSAFRDQGCSYDSVKMAFETRTWPYFERSRKIIDALGLTGPIVWSNLAKCENANQQKELPPIQTLRHCAGRFLLRELKEVPPEWPVLAIGRASFHALAYLLPERAIVGISHPTGAFQNYRRLFERESLSHEPKLLKGLVDRAKAALSATEKQAVWLGEEKGAARQLPL